MREDPCSYQDIFDIEYQEHEDVDEYNIYIEEVNEPISLRSLGMSEKMFH